MEDLIGFEGSIIELANKLEAMGYQEIGLYQDFYEVLEEESVVVDHSTKDKDIQVFFEVVIMNYIDSMDSKILVVDTIRSDSDEENEEYEL